MARYAWLFALLPILPSPLQSAENLATFDPTQVELRHGETGWEIWSGPRIIKELGASEADAREALGLIRQLRLTQHGVIGTRGPIMEYWLADNKCPQGLVPAYRLGTIDRATLRAEQLAGYWCLRDARQIWFNFGTHGDDARQALEVIQKYQFNRIGYVGAGQPIMIYFMADSATQGKTSALPPSTAVSPLQLFQVRQLTAPSLALLNSATGEERLPFDWRRVELKREGLRWRLLIGRECLADFGTDENSAREALRTVQHYRFTEQCRLGDSTTALTYYLVNGQAPHGVRFGATNIAFRPEGLTVRQMDGRWMICEGVRPVISGGATEAEARRVLKTIQQHQFDNLCRVGNSEQASLSFFVKDR